MNALRNNTVSLIDNPYVDPGIYRILDVIYEENILFLFLLGQTTNSAKPLKLDLNDFNYLIEGNYVSQIPYQGPSELLLSDTELSLANKELRDRNYALIRHLVEDPFFLRDFCSKRRSNIVIEHATNLKINPLKVYRALRKYWEYGQTPNTLLNFTSQYGGRGKDKSASTKQRGRPINNGIFFLRKKTSVNVTKQDQVNIMEAIRAELDYRKKLTFTGAYNKYKEMFCEIEFSLAVEENRPAQIPSYKQFCYWAKKLISKQEIISSQMSESAYRKDHVGSLSSVNDKFVAPGMRYEIDSTTADVYVVCEVDRQRVLGRPTIYFVVDVASRMIVGMHISMKYASWEAARQALFNACMPKVEFCKRYGIDIEQKDWPCVGVSATLMADRAEMLGKDSFEHATRVGTQLKIAATARGDMKSIVERRFGIANEELHFLPGTTLGELRKRGEPDYRLDAAMTLTAVTKILIEKVLEHNKFNDFKDILTRDLIQHDLMATPQNYWNFYTARYQSGLKVYSENHFIALLMNRGEASVRDQGIIFRELRYSCQKAIDEDWPTRALQSGSWKVECRYDESWSTDIFIREPNGKEFLRCKLIPAHRTYADLTEMEVQFVKEWQNAKSESPNYDHNKIQRSKRTNEIIKEEVKLTRATADTKSKRAKIADIRMNRKEHLERERPKLPQSNNTILFPTVTSVDRSEKMRKLFESTRREDDVDV